MEPPPAFSPIDPNIHRTAVVLKQLESVAERLPAILSLPDPSLHYGININVMELLDSDSWIGEMCMNCPIDGLEMLDSALQLLQHDTHEQSKKGVIKPFLHARLVGLPSCPELTKPNISCIRSGDVGKLVALRGTIIRTGGVKILEHSVEYECAKCHHVVRVMSDIEQNNIIQVPTSCPNRPNGKCKSTQFTPVEGSHFCRDYQELKLQEQVANLSVGSIPRSIIVVVQDDLVDSCQAGDDVVVVGVMRWRWLPVKVGLRCELELFVEANSLDVTNNFSSAFVLDPKHTETFVDFWRKHAVCPLKARNWIVDSMCPNLYGLFLVKLAVILTLIGGVPELDAQGKVRTRGQSHLLIVGDPGTGKSQLLKYASKLSSRSVLTTGIGSTTAGLTVTAVKDSGGWALEAGALVLADGGICCIDEFACLSEADRGSIHEAMEQQTLSVAKAGMVCTLNTRCTVFAVLNPKGVYDKDQDLVVNTAIASPLLSRFDLILLMLDNQSQDWDEKVTDYILDHLEPLEGAAAPTGPPKVNVKLASDFISPPSDPSKPSSNSETERWSLDQIRAYLVFVKHHFNPRLPQQSRTILTRYYQQQRRLDGNDASRTTIRLLESLIRLAQAHARLMCRDTVLPQDAIMAVTLMDSSIQSTSLMGARSTQYLQACGDPDELYRTHQQDILKCLAIRPISAEEEFCDYNALTCQRFQPAEPLYLSYNGEQDQKNSQPQTPQSQAPQQLQQPHQPQQPQQHQQSQGQSKSQGYQLQPQQLDFESQQQQQHQQQQHQQRHQSHQPELQSRQPTQPPEPFSHSQQLPSATQPLLHRQPLPVQPMLSQKQHFTSSQNAQSNTSRLEMSQGNAQNQTLQLPHQKQKESIDRSQLSQNNSMSASALNNSSQQTSPAPVSLSQQLLTRPPGLGQQSQAHIRDRYEQGLSGSEPKRRFPLSDSSDCKPILSTNGDFKPVARTVQNHNALQQFFNETLQKHLQKQPPSQEQSKKLKVGEAG